MDFFDCIAPIYDKFAWIVNQKHSELLKLGQFKKNDKVLDLGGGTGRIAKLLKPFAGEVIVLDPSLEMLKQCRDPAIKCQLGTAEAISYPENYFDKINI